MGLDITAMSELEVVDLPEGMEKWSNEYYEWEEELGKGSLYSLGNDDYFTTQLEGLPKSGLVSATGDKFYFRAGSYSGYGEWRNDLALASMGIGAETVWKKADDGEKNLPFSELINFSDADGIIGPMASQRLYQDFVKYEKKIIDTIDQWYLKMSDTKEYDSDDVRWFITKYNDWKNAFKIASNNGMVLFH